MRKVLLALFLALAFTGAQGQLTQSFVVTGNATPAGAQTSMYIAGQQAGLYSLTFVPSGTVSTCTVKVQDSSDNSSFSDRGVVQTCTSTGSYSFYVTPTSYVRLNITAQTGSGTVLYTLNATPNTPAVTSVSSIALNNGTSGTISLSAPTGALGTQTVTSPRVTSTIEASLGNYQGTTSVPITTGNFTALVAAASDIPIPASTILAAGQKIRIHASGVYTNAAASLLNAQLMLCTVSGCGSGTVVTPAGCTVVATNQANNLTNGQWTLDCTLTSTSTLGASGTFMAKALGSFNLGSATSAVQSVFSDTATAVSAAVDQTVAEFANVAFKFTTSNAGNSAIALEVSVELVK